MRRWLRGIVAVLALLSAVTLRAAEVPRSDKPVLLSADQITYDEELQLVVASGNVEISQNDRVLLADSVTYNQRSGTVSASGNVSLLEPDGHVAFADYVEITDDFREAVITNIRLLLSDRSKMAAASARRSGGNRTELYRAVYSPCELCKEDPTRAPLWQLKAVRVVHDQEEKRIEYRDAWMEIYGVPVLYTPYLSHPDPTVKRQSGFLRPSFGLSEDLGFTTNIPFFWAIADDKDATIEPMITTKQTAVLIGEYRHRVRNGSLRLGGSATVADRQEVQGGQTVTHENQFRGHVDSTGRFDINDYWRWGFDANRTTDKTYLRFYDFGSPRTLTSRLFAEGFHARNYAMARGLAFQGLRNSDDNQKSPIILPQLAYNFVGEPSRYGGYYTFDGDLLTLTRIDGRDSRRLSLRTAWNLPYVAPAGDIYLLTASLRGDGYWVDGVAPDSSSVDPSGDTDSGLAGRVFPQLAFNWRYPFARHLDTTHQVIEPIFGLVASPPGLNPGKIPNEDSLDVEFDETNLFDPNRFPGLDRVDSGPRADYGLKYSVLGDGGGMTSVFFGQSYRFTDNNEFADGTGLADQLSDIVGRLQISPNRYLDLVYRVRFDADDLALRRNELNLQAGPPALNLDLTYAYLDEKSGPTSDFGKRHEIRAAISSQITERWSARIAARRDIEEKRMLNYGLGVAYADECIELRTSVERTEYKDEEVDPDTRFLLTIAFKNLGEIGGQF